jgi:AP-4 complex subunit mu-1
LQRGKGNNLFPGAARGPTGVIKSVLDTSRTNGGRRDEIFVDIVEKVSCTFNSSGYIQNSQIDGAIQVTLPSSLAPRLRM